MPVAGRVATGVAGQASSSLTVRAAVRVAGGTRPEVRAVPAAAVPAAAVLAAATRAAGLGQALVVRGAAGGGAPRDPRAGAARARVVRIQGARPAARQRGAASRAPAAR